MLGALFAPVLPILVASVYVVLLSCACMAGSGSGSFAELVGVLVSGSSIGF